MADTVVVCRLFAFIFGLAGVLFLVLATPTHHWHVQKLKSNDTIYGGIWETCRQDKDGMYSCLPLKTSDWLNAVKTFMILSIVLYIFVIIYLIIMVWGRGMTIKLMGIDLLFAAMFAVIGVSIYTGKHNLLAGYQYGWSYSLGWAGAVCAIISGVLCFFSDVDYEPMK